jgi:hypothetical protein
VSTYTPTDADLQFARNVLAGSHDDFLPHYFIGVVRSLVGLGDNPGDRTDKEMVRMIRAAFVAYDERRDR